VGRIDGVAQEPRPEIVRPVHPEQEAPISANQIRLNGRGFACGRRNFMIDDGVRRQNRAEPGSLKPPGEVDVFKVRKIRRLEASYGVKRLCAVRTCAPAPAEQRHLIPGPDQQRVHPSGVTFERDPQAIHADAS
jgi:hypothetical protein